MPIVFHQVSYTYADLKQREKERRARERSSGGLFGKKKPKPAFNGSSQKNSSSLGDIKERADWGSSADALWALRNVSFTLEDGEFLGIAGHTGSGKSTLIQHMNGLVHPTEGQVLVDGENIVDKKAARKARGKVGVVFQYPEYQLFAATVYEDVAFGPRNLGLSEEEIDARVKHALGSVGLVFDEVQGKSPFELSGGQQRRVAFAGVLAMQPQVLVLDEPVAGLDPQAREDFLELITDLHEQGITIVMVSHTMDDLARMCDRVLVLNQGEVFALGSPEEVFSKAEELRSVGLGVPAAQALANRLRQHEGIPFNLNRTLYDADNLAEDLASLYHSLSSTEEANHVC